MSSWWLILAVFFLVVFRVGQNLENFLTCYLDRGPKGSARPGWGAKTLTYSLMDGLLMGIFGGVAIVLPYLLPFLVGLAVLEDSGYLPREWPS